MTTDPIEDYLDQLLPRLRGPAARVRRILAETEEHLRDATAEGVAAGLDRDEAAHRAVQRFGDPGTVAGRFPMPLGAVLGELTRTAIALGAVALVAIGLSGGLAELLGHLFGPDAVAGDLPGVTYTAQRCADFLEYFPDAGSCARAAALHHWGEVVVYRVAAGVIGLLILAGYGLWRRRRGGTPAGVLPAGFGATVATSLYAVAGAVLALQALGAVAEGGSGSGQWLSGAVVALVLAVVYGVSLYRTVAGRPGYAGSASSGGGAGRSAASTRSLP